MEWVAIYSSRESSQHRDQTHVSWIGRRIPYHWATREAFYVICQLKMLSQSKQNKVGSALRATVCPLWPVQIKAKADLKKKKKSIWKCKTWTQTTCYIFLLQFNMVISKLFLFLTQFLSHILINTGGLPCPLRTWKWGIQDDTLKVKLKFNT